MGEKKKPGRKTESYAPAGGGGMGPISSAGLGMSLVERVRYIQEIQQASPIARAADTLKDIKMDGFGLLSDIFNKGAAVMRGVGAAYAQIRETRGAAVINQHIAGLTENVRGVERLRHELDPQANVELPDAQKMEKTKGLYVDSDWTPKRGGQVE